MKSLYFLFLVLFLIACHPSKTQKNEESIPLINWQFRMKQDTIWREATVPGSIHMDLWANHIIKNPFLDANEYDQQWISLKEWIYRTRFSKNKLDNYDYTSLVFDGLDTYAQIYLNGNLILETNNMFRKWEIDLKGLLKETNLLEIHFLPPEPINEEKAEQLPYRLPDNRVFTRKAPYQFGWDWGPKFVTVGIWKPVNIKVNSVAKIKQVHWETQEIKDSSAMVKGILEIESFSEQKLDLKLWANNQISKQEINLKKGTNYIKVDRRINHAKLWYPVGLGEPNLYSFKIDLYQQDRLIDSDKKVIGIREVELVQEKDSVGESFYFKVNGKPLFIRGANYIPQDNFLNTVDSNRYQKLIKSVVWANMNMLRVWGGGIYENDIFYELCDKNGILIWQDFMFSCAMYPGNKEFLDNVEQEIKEQVLRLKHHPSIALWCGNNEINNGWKDWGWQKQKGYSVADSTSISNDYQALFHELIPKVLNKYDSLRPYHPSSPTYGWGHEENFKYGDSHYWGVWWGEEPFDVFNNKVGRFVSEYGFQSMPNMATIKTFAKPKELFMFSKTLKAHQKHPKGYETITKYMRRSYQIPRNLEEFIYLSQVLQANGIKTAIESHRRHQPYCMGTLYWQLNDCWPVSSWSSIDYNYHKKALHYYVRDAYKNVILSSILNQNKLSIYGISNDILIQDFTVKMCQIDFWGDTLNHFESTVKLESNSSHLILNKNLDLFTRKTQSYFVSEIWKDNTLCDVSYCFFDLTKNLELPKTQLNIEIEKQGKKYLIRLFSDVFIKDLSLEGNIEGEFSENFFNLPAKQSKTIWFYPQEDKVLNIKYHSMERCRE